VKWWMAVLAVIIGAGCEAPQKPAPQASTHSVLDVSPTPAQTAYAPMTRAPGDATPVYRSATPVYLPPGGRPAYLPPNDVVVDAGRSPTPAVIQMPPVEPVAATESGSHYTVKHGDTLFKIAREQYGDGKKWQQIASANPGVTPATLKVGQKLVMP
jgi:nucleoid-associated protein YgaU